VGDGGGTVWQADTSNTKPAASQRRRPGCHWGSTDIVPNPASGHQFFIPNLN
jgi:hypothetical protein